MRISNNQLNKLLKKESADLLIWRHIQGKYNFTGIQLKTLINERKKNAYDNN